MRDKILLKMLAISVGVAIVLTCLTPCIAVDKREVEAQKSNYTFSLHGNVKLLWSYTNDDANVDFDSISDINGDGVDDAVVIVTHNSNNSILVLSGCNGSTIWSKAITGEKDLDAHSLQSDISGDRIIDVLVESDYKIYVLDGCDGSTKWDQSFDIDLDIFGEVYAWKDYDGDGIDDMIIVTTDWIDFNTSKVYLVKGDSGSIIWRRPLNGELSYPAPAKQNDFNTDGVCDFVIEANNRSQNKGTIFMLDGNDGAVIWSKTYTGRIHTCWGPSYSEDFNRDGFKDIIVVTRNQEHNIGKLFILKGNDGSVIWDKSYDLPLRVFPIADINRDGIKDIIVESNGLEALDGVDASQMWNNPLNPLMGYVDLAYDLNGDNKEDLVVVNTTENGLNKYMYTVTALSGVNSDKIWSSSFFHNLSINTSESLNEWPDIITRRSHDLTGDGIDDVILQLRYYSYYPITYSEGKVILISGKDGSEVCSAESTLDDHNVNIWVSMLDLNNDGINDLLIRTCKGVYAVSVAMNDG